MIFKKNKNIKRIKKLCPRWDSNPQSLGFEATEHLRNRMRKENCRLQLELFSVGTHTPRGWTKVRSLWNKEADRSPLTNYFFNWTRTGRDSLCNCRGENKRSGCYGVKEADGSRWPSTRCICLVPWLFHIWSPTLTFCRAYKTSTIC